MGFDPITMAATISKLKANGQIGSEGKKSFSSAFTPSPTEFAKFPDDVKMPEGVIGMTANVKFAGEGYYFLNNPKENRDEDYYFSFNSNDPADPDFWFIANNTNSGMLNKRSFGIGGNVSKVCPTFWLNYPEYTNIAYFYEPTSDNLGLGMTVPAGWFALNTTTFALTPFDLINNPIIVPSDFTPVTAQGTVGMDFIKANWFELKKEISFVIKEKNLLIHEGIGNVCFADISALWDVNDEMAAKLGTTCVFVFHESSTESGHKWLLLLPETVEYITLTYSGGIKPIDPKYLGIETETTVLFEGTPMKLDLSSYGVGIVYQLSTEDLVRAAESLDVHFEYEVGGQKHSGVLNILGQNEIGAISYFRAEADVSFAYVEDLGGSGFIFAAGDIGDISNMRVWTEYNADKPYYISRSPNIKPDPDTWYPFSHEKAVTAAQKGLLILHWQNGYDSHHFDFLLGVDWGSTDNTLRMYYSYSGQTYVAYFTDGVLTRFESLP